MRWLILGAGALGGYYGARLIDAGEQVTFIVRDKRRQQLTANGLRVFSPEGDSYIAKPDCISEDQVKADYDGVILSAKAYDLDSAMDAIAPAIEGDTFVLPLLNGLTHVDALQKRFGKKAVLGGVCFISAALDDKGQVEHFNHRHSLGFGELDGQASKRIETIAQSFAKANFSSEPTNEIVQKMWEKWIFIATVAGGTCLMRASVGDIVRAGGGGMLARMYREAADIATLNAHTPRSQVATIMQNYLANQDSTLMASMLKDLERGKPTEEDHIIGELVARAGKEGKTPLLNLALAHIKAAHLRRQREAQVS